MNQINPKKLLNSKWTAVQPANKEKHFTVIEVEYDEDQNVTLCAIQAIHSLRIEQINWRDLKNTNQWKMGWC